MPARDVADRRDHYRDCETVREGDGDEGQAAVHALRLRAVDRRQEKGRQREDGAGADEDEREGADELGDAAAHRVVIHAPRRLRGRPDGT